MGQIYKKVVILIVLIFLLSTASARRAYTIISEWPKERKKKLSWILLIGLK